jgi:hypothetical protein
LGKKEKVKHTNIDYKGGPQDIIAIERERERRERERERSLASISSIGLLSRCNIKIYYRASIKLLWMNIFISNVT